MVASSTKETSDGFVGHVVISGNLTQRFVVFNDTAYDVRPCFRWNGIVRLTWLWMLLCGDERGKTTHDLLDCQESLIELPVRDEKVDQHW
jgi:hypothetical protein